MEKGYFFIIYILVVFCGGCAISAVFEGTATAIGTFLVVSGLAMVVYIVRLIGQDTGHSGVNTRQLPETTQLSSGDVSLKN